MSQPTQRDSTLTIWNRKRWGGISQLTLVEHALCPLAPNDQPFVFEPEYAYYARRKKHTAKPRVHCAGGLFPNDEFYLWGLLALTFSQSEPTIDFYASARYCIKQLGYRIGGKQIRDFAAAVNRLSLVTYVNPQFYDPNKHEFCKATFGFFSVRSPLDDDSLRAWRIAWDPIFFDYVKPTGGFLAFDLETYRQLSFASRRLFLFLKKIFYRRKSSSTFELRRLAQNVLGYSASLSTKHMKQKVLRSVAELQQHAVLATLTNNSPELVQKLGKGNYQITFRPGSYFDQPSPNRAAQPSESHPLWESLVTIGLKKSLISRLLRSHNAKFLQEASDITLARLERGLGFTRSPQAFFMDYLKQASAGKRTPPDWWYELKKEEQRNEDEQAARRHGFFQGDASETSDAAFLEFLKGEGRQRFEHLVQDMFGQLQAEGRSPEEARRDAVAHVRDHMKNRFLAKSAA